MSSPNRAATMRFGTSETSCGKVGNFARSKTVTGAVGTPPSSAPATPGSRVPMRWTNASATPFASVWATDGSGSVTRIESRFVPTTGPVATPATTLAADRGRPVISIASLAIGSLSIIAEKVSMIRLTTVDRSVVSCFPGSFPRLNDAAPMYRVVRAV